jgi:hypothetical protein
MLPEYRCRNLASSGAGGRQLAEVGFSVAVSGMTIPPADLRSSASRRTTTRSCNGRMFTTPSISLKIKSFVPGLGTRYA